jgi:2-keto-4-pentenoate hydratase/2-oxohepta-3-ene-1,7-dioic acid hydratase in catechol pathway
MRYCRFNNDRLGVVRRDMVHDVTAVLDKLPAFRWPLPSSDPLVAALPRIRGDMEALADRVIPVPIASVKLLNPVPNPSKVIGAPVNYHAHIDEANRDQQISFGKTIKTIDHYGVFLKSNSSLSGPSEPVPVVEKDRRTDHEVELAAIIGETCFDVPEDGALKYIAGYAIGLDMTIRGPEERSLRKSLDRFSVVGPYIVTADEIPDPENLDLEILVNGQVRQKSNTSRLIFGVAKLISYCSNFYRLYPGDIIMTGTPEGVGPVQAGDVMHARIEKIGEMTVAVARRTEPLPPPAPAV